MLGAMAARGMRLAVLSNKPHDATEECVQGFLCDVRFHIVAGADQRVSRGNQIPPERLHSRGRSGLSPQECLYVGDTATDMQTAVRAGMIPVGVLWGFRHG